MATIVGLSGNILYDHYIVALVVTFCMATIVGFSGDILYGHYSWL